MNSEFYFFNTFKNRYIIKGTLELKTSTHVGSGRDNEFTDATIMKDENGYPYIPGSSLKGIIRSNAERIIATLDSQKVFTCLLNEEYLNSINKSNNTDKTCLMVNKDEASKLKKEKGNKFYDSLLAKTCTVCRVFGSKECASKIKISDAFLTPECRDIVDKRSTVPEKILKIRDGIRIDRDTGTVVESAKYDYEVVWKNMKFDFEMVVENVQDWELGLIVVGMLDMLSGEQYIGGKTSKGLGRCILSELSVKALKKDGLENMLKDIATGEGDITSDSLYKKYKDTTESMEFLKNLIGEFYNYAFDVKAEV